MNFEDITAFYKKYFVRTNIKIFLIISFIILATYEITTWNIQRQFKVLYNLDAQKNDEEIINLINGANKYIYFAIYTFTKENIADALISAKNRGIIVWGITDKNESESDYEQSIIRKLQLANIPIETQRHQDGIMHIKSIVTDNAYAIGSYNWTDSATYSNDELLEIGFDSTLHDRYLEIIKKILIINQ